LPAFPEETGATGLGCGAGPPTWFCCLLGPPAALCAAAAVIQTVLKTANAKILKAISSFRQLFRADYLLVFAMI
jgi:hypothetical protein